MAFTALYLPITVACTALFFVPEPEVYGLQGMQSAAIAGAMGVAVFGFMLVLAIQQWAAYYLERLTIDGTKVWLRTLIQNHHFDIAELRSLKWKTTTHGGSIVLRLLSSSARLDLSGYEKGDRLQIIRVFRGLVPDDIQEGWPLFCHRVALPLRDGSVKTRIREPGAQLCTITRRRYDRTFAVLVPVATVLTLFISLWFNLWQLLAMPVVFVLAWLTLRFHAPREGFTDTRLTSTASGRLFMVTFAVMIATQLMMIGLRLYGVEREVACSAGCVIVLPAFPVFLLFLWKAEKRRSVWERQTAESTQLEWEVGEANAAAASLGD